MKPAKILTLAAIATFGSAASAADLAVPRPAPVVAPVDTGWYLRGYMPQPNLGIIELFSGGVTEAPKQQLVKRDEAQPKVRHGQPKASASPKATEDAPRATSRSVLRPASKKANTTPPLDVQREQQLYQEFLEWRNRQKDQP